MTEAQRTQRVVGVSKLLNGLHPMDYAAILDRLGLVSAEDGNLRALARYRVQQDLVSRTPDPRVLKLATELEDDVVNSAPFTLNIVPYTVPDVGVPRILAECDEKILDEACTALADRLDQTRVTDTDIVACYRKLFRRLAERFAPKTVGERK